MWGVVHFEEKKSGLTDNFGTGASAKRKLFSIGDNHKINIA